MRKFRVSLHTVASATVTVDVPDDVIARVAENYAVSVEDVDTDMLHEAAENLAHESTPRLCHHCVGYGNPRYSLDLGDDWEVDEYTNNGVTSRAVEEVNSQ
jgi:hypothetical protein